MKEYKLAKKAAKAAGKLLMKYYGKKIQIKKKSEIDLVTEVDEKAQNLITEMIRKKFPEDAILAEEGELAKTQQAKRRWIIDPLDGTTNYAHHYPRFCVSIAFEKNSQLMAGAIYDPVMKEMFSAKRGSKPKLNGKAIALSQPKNLKESLLVTGFPYDLNDPRLDNLKLFKHLLFKAQAIRRDGSAALNLAYVAAGRFDGFWELGLNAWDSAAGLLLLEMAGGRIEPIQSDMHGGIPRSFIAGSPHIVDEISAEIRSLV